MPKSNPDSPRHASVDAIDNTQIKALSADTSNDPEPTNPFISTLNSRSKPETETGKFKVEVANDGSQSRRKSSIIGRNIRRSSRQGRNPANDTSPDSEDMAFDWESRDSRRAQRRQENELDVDTVPDPVTAQTKNLAQTDAIRHGQDSFAGQSKRPVREPADAASGTDEDHPMGPTDDDHDEDHDDGDDEYHDSNDNIHSAIHGMGATSMMQTFASVFGLAPNAGTNSGNSRFISLIQTLKNRVNVDSTELLIALQEMSELLAFGNGAFLYMTPKFNKQPDTSKNNTPQQKMQLVGIVYQVSIRRSLFALSSVCSAIPRLAPRCLLAMITRMIRKLPPP